MDTLLYVCIPASFVFNFLCLCQQYAAEALCLPVVHRLSVCPLTPNTRNAMSVLSGVNSVKRTTNIHHVSERSCKDVQGQR